MTGFFKEILLSTLCTATYIQTTGQGTTFKIDPAKSGYGSAIKKPINKFPIYGIETDALWMSYSGAISLDHTNDVKVHEGIQDNLIISAMWGPSAPPMSGKINVKVVKNEAALSKISSIINSNVEFNNFTAKRVLAVDYKNIQNPADSREVNSFQMFYAIDDDDEGALIFNYHNVTWMPEDAEVGVFAGKHEYQQCNYGFDVEVEELSSKSNCENVGIWVLPASKSGLQCNQHFETECPEAPEGHRSTHKSFMRTEGSTDSDKWVWQTKYTCLPRHQLSRTQSSITAECLYDADYYDSRWSHEPPTCQDFTAMKTYEVQMQHDPLSMALNGFEMAIAGTGGALAGDAIDAAVLDSSGQQLPDDFSNVILNSLHDITSSYQIDSQITSDILSSVENEKDEKNRELMNSEPFDINFELSLPAVLKDKLPASALEQMFSEYIGAIAADQESSENNNFKSVQIIETTSQCLTECLGCKSAKCSGKPPPIPFDSCCGKCQIVNGQVFSSAKPYASLLSACCPNEINGSYIYDPTKFVCCPFNNVENDNVLISLNDYGKYGSDQKTSCAIAIKGTSEKIKINSNML